MKKTTISEEEEEKTTCRGRMKLSRRREEEKNVFASYRKKRKGMREKSKRAGWLVKHTIKLRERRVSEERGKGILDTLQEYEKMCGWGG